jgi:predicted acylesterase/phospholipase RssA
MVEIRGDRYDRRTVSLALWWRNRGSSTEDQPPQGWENLFLQPRFPGWLPEAEFGLLRQVKLAAWYLRLGLNRTPPVDGGVPPARHLERFFDTIQDVDEEMAQQLRTAATANLPLREQVLDFVMELYYLRSAEVMSPRVRKDWDRLSLGEAVGASACFPPVFPPLRVLGFYDDLWVTRLGLTRWRCV